MICGSEKLQLYLLVDVFMSTKIITASLEYNYVKDIQS